MLASSCVSSGWSALRLLETDHKDNKAACDGGTKAKPGRRPWALGGLSMWRRKAWQAAWRRENSQHRQHSFGLMESPGQQLEAGLLMAVISREFPVEGVLDA